MSTFLGLVSWKWDSTATRYKDAVMMQASAALYHDCPEDYAEALLESLPLPPNNLAEGENQWVSRKMKET